MTNSGHAGAGGLRQLLDAIVSIGSDLDLASMLRRIVEAAASLVDARYAALGVLDESRTRLAEFIPVGIDEATRRAIGGAPKGLGILGSLITDAQPLRLARLSDHPDSAGFPPGHPPMTSFMGVPVLVRNEVFGNLYLADKTTAAEFSEVDEELVVALAAAAGVAIANARLFEQGRRREAALVGMQEVATRSLVGLPERDVLQLIAGHVRRLVTADLAFVAVPVEGAEATMVVEAADGERAERLWGRAFPADDSIAGRVAAGGHAVAVDDLAAAEGTSAGTAALAGAGPGILVPMWCEGRPLGVLAAVKDGGAAPFSPDEVELASSFSAHVTVVLERERARRRLETLSLLEDEERIARDLHDSVIRRTFSAGLLLQGAMPRVVEPEARRRIEQAIRELDATVHHIRSVVFDMAAPRPRPAPIRSAVLDATRDASFALGFEPRVVVSGPLDAMPEDEAADLIVTLRDVLAQVAGHGSVTAVEVEVAVDGHSLLRVREDGAALEDGADDGTVVEAARRRAEKHGGEAFLWRTSAGGVFEWSVPAGVPRAG
ncbi:MAG TPA: GAF domain-containing protein [Acidimicrobiales bacterium]|nr:GAF domain-containing protein [Acidimicrobiales bacterium]